MVVRSKNKAFLIGKHHTPRDLCDKNFLLAAENDDELKSP